MTAHRPDDTVCSGDVSSFTSTATIRHNPGTFLYQWQAIIGTSVVAAGATSVLVRMTGLPPSTTTTLNPAPMPANAFMAGATGGIQHRRV
ncbi:MAG: hypothetical protein IPM82_28710 [Saprospiraceae bacterium]|nr:hypothetical protein [Saprospiraceae bacterium]